jgi:hypothetical protein
MPQDIDNKDYIVPGATEGMTEEGLPPPDAPSRNDRRWWHILCPSCGHVHHRIVKEEWEDDPETVLKDQPTGRAVNYQCFICTTNYLHFKISPDWPFRIEYETKFRLDPTPLKDAEDGVSYFTKKREE